uniref:Uncharacterized protein n=1 Tax=Panagrellus redivivus TaxID=6233 RepID=A0A7E4W1U5_PANRE
MKWIIAICVGLALLLIIAVVVGFCLCMRLKKKPVHPANSVRQAQQSTLPPKSNGSHKKRAKSNPRSMTSPLPRTPPSKTNNSETKLEIPRNSPHSNIRQTHVSDSATSNDTV